jgi:hypothetical protein
MSERREIHHGRVSWNLLWLIIRVLLLGRLYVIDDQIEDRIGYIESFRTAVYRLLIRSISPPGIVAIGTPLEEYHCVRRKLNRKGPEMVLQKDPRC